jgi:hypothetical protein
LLLLLIKFGVKVYVSARSRSMDATIAARE